MTVSDPGTTERLVALEDIQAAAQRLAGFARRTPLLPVREAGPPGVGPLRLKCENLQRAGAFKARGAYNFIARLTPEARSRGVVTYSSGNHGRAVALAARELGASATVVVPVDAPEVKVNGIRQLGADVIEEGATSVQRQQRAEAVAAASGAVVIPPFDHRDIIAGQGTVGLEIIEDWPEVERVLVPVGGGGLLAGVAAAVRSVSPDVEVYGVEPEGAAAMRRSLDAGEPMTLESVDTIADGLRPVRPGDLTLDHARALVNGVVVVDDVSILKALAWCAKACKLIVEPSGAAGLAALLFEAVPARDSSTVVVLSGGNVDPMRWGGWVQEYGRESFGDD